MRVLHTYNLHRGRGGADNVTLTTIAALRSVGVQVDEFVRDSRELSSGLAGKLIAFSDGLYAHRAVREFAARLDSERPDLVHVHELYPLISPWVLPQCSRRGIPVAMSVYDFRLTCPTHNHFFDGKVCTRCLDETEVACVRQNCRGNLSESAAYAMRNALARQLALFTKHVSCFITPTRFTADWLVQHAGIRSEAVQVLPCPIEIPQTPVPDPAAGTYLAFAGRFVPEKGADVAIKAARLCGVPLRLAGDRHQSVTGLENDDLIHHFTTGNRQELNDFYRGARALVVPSIWFETFATVASEAMSHGIPVLASRIGAVAEVVQDGVTGLHFEAGNADDLALKLRALWDNPDLVRSLGRRARAHVVSNCSPDTQVDRLLTIYRSLLAADVRHGHVQ